MNKEGWANIVTSGGKCYLVDTRNTPDHGWETMIFRSKPQPETDDCYSIMYGKIIWRDLYAELHRTREAAKARHEEIVQNIGEYVK